MSLPTMGLLGLLHPQFPQTSTVRNGLGHRGPEGWESVPQSHTVSLAGSSPDWRERPLAIPATEEEVTN